MNAKASGFVFSPAKISSENSQLKLFVKNAPVALAMLDREMRYIVASEKWITDLLPGYTDITGKSHYEVFPNLPQRWLDVHQRCLAGAVEKSDNDRMVNPDGKVRFIRWEIRPWKTENDEVGGIIIFSEDITHRKTIEEKLGFLATVTQNIADAVISTDLQFNITSWNHGAENLYGWKEDEVLGKSAREILQTRILSEDSDYFKALDTVGYWRGEAIQKKSDGTDVHILASLAYVKDKSGEKIGAVAVNRDISARAKIEDELLTRVKQQAIVSDLGLKALSGLDLQRLMNEAVQQLKEVLQVEYTKVLELLPSGEEVLLRAGVGWNPDIVVHKSRVDSGMSSQAGYTLYTREPVIVKDLRTETRFSGPPLLRNHNVVSGMSCIIWGKDKPYGVLGIHSVHRRDFSQNDVHFLQSVANILAVAIQRFESEHTQRRLSESLELMVKIRTEELQRSNDDLQQFAHVASHDMKEPLRKIQTFSSRLYDKFAASWEEEAVYYLKKIQHAASRMNAMVEGVLNYSTSGAMRIEAHPVDLNEVIRQIETDLELLIHQKGATLTRDPLPVVEGASVLLYQLFYNLINNSLKFSVPLVSPAIHIRAEKYLENSKEWAVIEVSDNGIGFEAEYADRIFDAFTRLHSKDKFEGTGLGLSLCKKIVHRHKGKISATGKPGGGSVFRVQLPLRQDLG